MPMHIYMLTIDYLESYTWLLWERQRPLVVVGGGGGGGGGKWERPEP